MHSMFRNRCQTEAWMDRLRVCRVPIIQTTKEQTGGQTDHYKEQPDACTYVRTDGRTDRQTGRHGHMSLRSDRQTDTDACHGVTHA